MNAGLHRSQILRLRVAFRDQLRQHAGGRLFFLVFMHNKGLYVYNLALIYAFYSLLDLIHSHCQTVES